MLDELLERLNGEAEALLYELNVTLPREIEKAVAQGDLSENSEYTAALERQQFVRARLDHISRRLGEVRPVCRCGEKTRGTRGCPCVVLGEGGERFAALLSVVATCPSRNPISVPGLEVQSLTYFGIRSSP